MVTAKDGAPDPRIATATVSIAVEDVEDELPVFSRSVHEATVPENVPDYFVTDVKVLYGQVLGNLYNLDVAG